MNEHEIHLNIFYNETRKNNPGIGWTYNEETTSWDLVE